MNQWNRANDLREYEGKEMREDQYSRLKKRVSLEGGPDKTTSLRYMAQGLFFALSLTGFEFALRNPEVEGLLENLFRLGFYLSVVGVLLIPYGLYHLIRKL